MKRLIVFSAFAFSALYAHNQYVSEPSERNVSSLADSLVKLRKENKAFTYGEKLSYRIHYGFLDGGKAHFTVADKPESIEGRNTYYVKVTGSSAGLVDMMFKVKDQFESFIDEEAIVPLRATKNVKEGNYTDVDYIIFNHEKQTVSSKRGKLNIVPNTQDIISAIYYARITNMSTAKIGDVFPVPFYLDGKTYELRFKYVARETIKTDLGKFRALKIKPQLIEGRVFKDNDALTLWVTDDENHIPLRVESDIFVGAIKADLISMSGVRNAISSKVN